jgi:hypothetical protein
MKSSFGLDAVNIALLPEDNGKQGNKSLPLVLTPRWNSSKLFPMELLQTIYRELVPREPRLARYNVAPLRSRPHSRLHP